MEVGTSAESQTLSDMCFYLTIQNHSAFKKGRINIKVGGFNLIFFNKELNDRINMNWRKKAIRI